MAEQINSTLTLGDCERALIEESGVTPLGTPSPSESFYKPGDWLGEYQLDRLLGSGGTGHVYRAGKRVGAASEVGSGWSSLVALKPLTFRVRLSVITLFLTVWCFFLPL